MEITKEQLGEGRLKHLDFRLDRCGSFYNALFIAIATSKYENTYKIAQGFPAEVYAYFEYTGMLSRIQFIEVVE